MLARFSHSPVSDGAFSKANWRGYALGISIAQILCAALGHELSVSSRPGPGAVIWLKVALAKAAERLDKPAGAAANPPSGNQALIALVEDDPELYLATTQLLTDWGYRVFGGGSAEDAIADCQANAGGRRPDLLLSDFKLPNDQTAVDVIEALSRHFGGKIPTIVVSGDPSAASDITVAGSQFEILQKPIRAAKLRAIIRYTLDNAD
jgi:CheY-like chemotaxis protein